MIVHELAHLVEPGHGPAFQELAGRYPLAERAEGFLIAKAGGTDADTDPMANDVDVDPDAIPLGPGDAPAAPPSTVDDTILPADKRTPHLPFPT